MQQMPIKLNFPVVASINNIAYGDFVYSVHLVTSLPVHDYVYIQVNVELEDFQCLRNIFHHVCAITRLNCNGHKH